MTGTPNGDVRAALTALYDLGMSLQDQQDVLLGRITRFERTVLTRLYRLELTMSAVDEKLNDLNSAVGDAATALDQLRTELADASQPGTLSDDQAQRFDNIIGSLRSAVTGPSAPTA